MDDFATIEVEDTFSGRLNPYQRLWITVTLICVNDILTGNDRRGYARSFIKDPDNEYFQFASESLNLNPDFFRGKIFEMLERLELLGKSRKKTNPVTGGMKQSVGLRAVGVNRKWQFL